MASCIICFTIYSSEDVVILLNCQHCYHKRCIENWIKYDRLSSITIELILLKMIFFVNRVRTECPQCRKKIQYNKSLKLFLNFTGQMDEDVDKKPNLMLCRAVKAYSKTIKEQEMQLTDKKYS